MDPYKEQTKKSYDLSAEKYAQNVSELSPKKQIQQFATPLPKGAKILDIGCGSGRDAKIFSGMGLKVVGVDFSITLLEIAKSLNPEAEFYQMDMEKLSFPNCSFDGAWANTSLLHIPKAKLPSVLGKIHSFLKEEALFYLSLKKGTGEIFEKDHRYGNVEKFWSFFEEGEIQAYLKQTGFQILSLSLTEKKNSYETHPLIYIFCKKSSIPSI